LLFTWVGSVAALLAPGGEAFANLAIVVHVLIEDPVGRASNLIASAPGDYVGLGEALAELRQVVQRINHRIEFDILAVTVNKA
jgi:hypothetical protein